MMDQNETMTNSDSEEYSEKNVINIIDNVEDNCDDTFEIDSNITHDSICSNLGAIKDDKKEIYEEETSASCVLINTRPLPSDATTYRLEEFEKKVLYIFNQINISGFSEARKGTKQDVAQIKKAFGSFDFDIKLFDDLTENEIFTQLDELKTVDYSDVGCIGVIVLTHGHESGLLMARDHAYAEAKILNYFKSDSNPSLLTKPKFLILQACRGAKISPGMGISMRSSRVVADNARAVSPYTLPVEADILVVHSTYHGNISYRDKTNGSWFIQSLCQNINQYSSTHDLETIIKQVQRDVAIKHINKSLTNDIYSKQMPVMTSTLFRKMYLRKSSADIANTVDFGNKVQGSISSDSMVIRHKISELTCPCHDLIYRHLRHNLELYVQQNSEDLEPSADVAIKAIMQFENDGRFKKHTLCDIISPILKDKAVLCNICKNISQF